MSLGFFEIAHWSITEDGNSSGAYPDLTIFTNPEIRRAYLIECEPHAWENQDQPIASVVTNTLRFSFGHDQPTLDSKMWFPQVLNPIRVTLGMSKPLPKGLSASSASGTVKIFPNSVPVGFSGTGLIWDVGDWDVDEWQGALVDTDDMWMSDYGWDGHRIRVWVGPASSNTFSDYTKVYDGQMADFEWGQTEAKITLRNLEEVLSGDLHRNVYAGTGAEEGGENLKDTPKPTCLGYCKNVTPVTVDQNPFVNLYQVNDGEVAFIQPFDQGNALYPLGDAGSLANLLAWEPDEDDKITGGFYTDLASGMYRTAAQPIGRHTADVQGVNDGPITTFPVTAGQMIRWIWNVALGRSDGEIDDGCFRLMDVAAPFELGFYSGSGSLDCKAVIDEILDSVGGYRSTSQNGDFCVGVFGFTASKLTIDNDVHNITEIARQRTPVPPRRVELEYNKNWTPMNESEIAPYARENPIDPSIPIADRFGIFDPVHALSGSNLAVAFDNAVTPYLHALSATRQFTGSLIRKRSDAEKEADRRLALLSWKRRNGVAHKYRVKGSDFSWLLQPGDTVTVKHPRFGLEDGQPFIVIAVTEDAGRSETTLELWG